MQFLQKPSGINFAGNICDIIVEATSPLTFGLSVIGGGVIVEEIYTPINGQIVVPMRDLMQRVAVTASVKVGLVDLPTYQYRFAQVTYGTFHCIGGGCADDVDTAMFLKNNWLTWQPQSRRTTYYTPQRLSYAIFDESTNYAVKVRGYFADGTNSEISLCTLAKSGIHTIDVTYGIIRGKFSQQPLYFDVWVVGNPDIESYAQRYYLDHDNHTADVFLWINSLGGVDSAIFTGELSEENKYQSNNALFNGEEKQYNVENRKTFKKSTGYIESDNERLWVLDFFNATERWHLDDGVLRKIVIISPELKHTRGDLVGYEFSFAHSKQSKYLNITRAKTPDVLRIIDPAGELFFLAPRLIQFKTAEVAIGEILFPVQYPNSDEWLKLSLADILRSVSAGSGSGPAIKHATTHAKDGSDPITATSIGAAPDNHNHDEKYAKKNGDSTEPFAASSVSTKNITGVNAVFENIVALNGITAPTFTSRIMTATGGINVTSAAFAKITRVENGGSYWKCYYKCSWQIWEALDQARLHGELGRFLWGLITAVSEQPDAKGEYSFNLSKSTLAQGTNTEPRIDDTLVLYGNRNTDSTKTYRKSIQIESCGVDNIDENFEPYSAKYIEIDSFELPKSKRVKWDGRDVDYVVSSFSIRGRDGIVRRQPESPIEYVIGREYHEYQQVRYDGSVWQCVATATTDEPSDSSFAWVCTLRKGGQGDKGDYQVTVYRWGEQKPARPVGSNPEGWSSSTEKGVALTDESGAVLINEAGSLLIEPYPESYLLWGSTATFSGATDDVIGEWSDPFQLTGKDGKPGETPLIYELLPSATIVKKDTAGVLSPATVNCRVALRRGNEREVIGVDPKIEFKGRNLLSSLPSNFAQGGWSHNGVTNSVGHLIAQKPPIASKAGITYQTKLLDSSLRVEIIVYDSSKQILYIHQHRGITGIRSFTTPEKTENITFTIGYDVFRGITVADAATIGRNIIICQNSAGVQWQPAPEDYAIKLNDAAYTAGTAVTPTDNLNWTLHDPVSNKEIDRKSTLIDQTLAAKVDAIAAFFPDGIDKARIEALLSEEDNTPFEVDLTDPQNPMVIISNAFVRKLAADSAFVVSLTAQLLKADSAFIRDLVARRIRTSGGEVDISDSLQKFGALTVNKADGTVEVKDDNGFNILSISNSPLPTWNWANSSISATTSITETLHTNNQVYDTPAVTVTGKGALLGISGTMDVATMSGSYTTIRAYLYDGRREYLLGQAIYPIIAGTGQSSAQDLRATRYVTAGVYRLRFRVECGGMFAAANIKQVMLAVYTNPDNRWIFGMDGYGWGLHGTGYDRTKVIPTGDKTNPFELYKEFCGRGCYKGSHRFEGEFDAPGVLAKALITSLGVIQKQWGTYKVTSVDNVTVGGANKRVYHNTGNAGYAAFCNGYGGADNPKVINETASYVDVYATGSFNIMLVGNNER